MDHLHRLRRFLELARVKTEEGSTARLEAFLILYELSSQDIIWRKHYSSWSALLKGEGIHSSAWGRFQSGVRAFGGSTASARRYGFEAVSRLGCYKVGVAKDIVANLKTTPLEKAFKERPFKPLLPPNKYRNYNRRELGAYIILLEKALKRAKINPPTPPWSDA